MMERKNRPARPSPEKAIQTIWEMTEPLNWPRAYHDQFEQCLDVLAEVVEDKKPKLVKD